MMGTLKLDVVFLDSLCLSKVCGSFWKKNTILSIGIEWRDHVYQITQILINDGKADKKETFCFWL